MEKVKMLSARLRQLMFLKGVTNLEFAKSIGASISSVGGWLSGAITPSASVIYQVCTVYHVSADWLLGIYNNE